MTERLGSYTRENIVEDRGERGKGLYNLFYFLLIDGADNDKY